VSNGNYFSCTCIWPGVARKEEDLQVERTVVNGSKDSIIRKSAVYPPLPMLVYPRQRGIRSLWTRGPRPLNAFLQRNLGNEPERKEIKR